MWNLYFCRSTFGRLIRTLTRKSRRNVSKILVFYEYRIFGFDLGNFSTFNLDFQKLFFYIYTYIYNIYIYTFYIIGWKVERLKGITDENPTRNFFYFLYFFSSAYFFNLPKVELYHAPEPSTRDFAILFLKVSFCDTFSKSIILRYFF